MRAPLVPLRLRGLPLGNRHQLLPPLGPSRSGPAPRRATPASSPHSRTRPCASSAPHCGHSPGQSSRHRGWTGSASADHLRHERGEIDLLAPEPARLERFPQTHPVARQAPRPPPGRRATRDPAGSRTSRNGSWERVTIAREAAAAFELERARDACPRGRRPRPCGARAARPRTARRARAGSPWPCRHRTRATSPAPSRSGSGVGRRR